MNIENRIEELGIKLPVPPVPVATYAVCKQCGNLVFVSGQGPIIEGKQMYTGKVGREVSREEGYQAARYCGINLLAQLKSYLGDLDKVKQVVHLKGFVASDNDFTEQPSVINGSSDLMVEVFGEAGRHTRCALGTNVLPTDIPVEVELVVEIAD
ncbi:MAG: RidA family protein [Clostridium sp.]|nr:RidA family protein [Enterocloster asparagiformis]MCD7909108.1 RidA family protein [Clostridium sp.]